MNSVYGKLVYTGKRAEKDAYVVFDGKKIVGVSVKPRGKVLGRHAVITPAFIDAHCHIGLVRAGEPSNEGEANDQLDMIMPVPDALDSVMMDDTSFRDAMEGGVLYSCVVPGSGQIIGGRSALIRNWARNTTEALVARAGLKGAMGYNPSRDKTKPGQRPGTRMGALSLLRRRLHDVRVKMNQLRRARGKKKDDLTFNAEEEVLRDVLTGKERLRMHVHKIDDIAALLRLADEFALKLTVEHTCDVHDPHIFEELKRRRVPVIYGPLDALAYKVELKHEDWRNIRHLLASGVEFGLMTDHPVILQKTLLMTLRWFLRCGMTKQDAIEIVTRRNAEVLDVGRTLGTLEKGKWASLVCWTGDPFDLANHATCAFGEGEKLFEAD
ncbi:MAG TPA: amidohydrolase family protein [Planctomycetota bacterium]|nr:amidohydrolase family protein [Planctomycetota bacterium]